jgi:hypothetical protein
VLGDPRRFGGDMSVCVGAPLAVTAICCFAEEAFVVAEALLVASVGAAAGGASLPTVPEAEGADELSAPDDGAESIAACAAPATAAAT